MAERPNVETLYHEALKKTSGQERSSYLDEVCGDDRALRARVEALLDISQEVGDFLENPAVHSNITLDDSPLIEGPGSTIGPYKLLEKICEGGMAAVYMAGQSQPVRRFCRHRPTLHHLLSQNNIRAAKAQSLNTSM